MRVADLAVRTLLLQHHWQAGGDVIHVAVRVLGYPIAVTVVAELVGKESVAGGDKTVGCVVAVGIGNQTAQSPSDLIPIRVVFVSDGCNRWPGRGGVESVVCIVGIGDVKKANLNAKAVADRIVTQVRRKVALFDGCEFVEGVVGVRGCHTGTVGDFEPVPDWVKRVGEAGDGIVGGAAPPVGVIYAEEAIRRIVGEGERRVVRITDPDQIVGRIVRIPCAFAEPVGDASESVRRVISVNQHLARQKVLGTGSVEACPMAVNRPVASTANPAMLFWPRLATYRNCPEDARCIWEQVLRAVYLSGKVVIVCTAERVPVAGSRR